MVDRAPLARCPVHGTSYDPGGRAGCPLCRIHAPRGLSGRPPPPRRWPFVALLALVVLLMWSGPERLSRLVRSLFPAPGEREAPAPFGVVTQHARPTPPGEPAPREAARCGEGPVRGMYASCTGALEEGAPRGGEYFLPERRRGTALPALIFLHREGESPARVLARVSPWAERRQFVLVAPAARGARWQVPSSAEATNADALHVLASLLEVQLLPTLALDAERVLIAGAGSGAAQAAYLATNHSELTALAALDGTLAPPALGPLRVPAWLSSRGGDVAPSAARVQRDAALLTERGFRAVHDEQPADAEAQLERLVRWWLSEAP